MPPPEVINSQVPGSEAEVRPEVRVGLLVDGGD
jgi:hypothetical protein